METVCCVWVKDATLQDGPASRSRFASRAEGFLTFVFFVKLRSNRIVMPFFEAEIKTWEDYLRAYEQ
ncbi:MAG: hypothetical protein RMM53_13820, partial [Bacteroidia bacterium]|nr:hypothetical protein [Bacteroidia bacterium]